MIVGWSMELDMDMVDVGCTTMIIGETATVPGQVTMDAAMVMATAIMVDMAGMDADTTMDMEDMAVWDMVEDTTTMDMDVDTTMATMEEDTLLTIAQQMSTVHMVTEDMDVMDTTTTTTDTTLADTMTTMVVDTADMVDMVDRTTPTTHVVTMITMAEEVDMVWDMEIITTTAMAVMVEDTTMATTTMAMAWDTVEDTTETGTTDMEDDTTMVDMADMEEDMATAQDTGTTTMLTREIEGIGGNGTCKRMR